MKQSRETMFFGHVFERLHHHLVVVRGDVGFFINRSNFILAWCDLVVARLGRNAELV
ncbi:MAG: hypothetical protein BWX99_02946 [Deltaproteobacteria bacterium ADurb.Bin151]|nr:MAG: hypothetical protein BWX99_02946 [Deltaproteobacteria bacterium ADurb.Bin151]